MRDRLLQLLASFQVKKPKTVLVIVLIMTLGFAFLASRLKQDMRWSDLLPTDDPKTIQFDRVINEFSSAANITVVVQGNEEKIKAFADEAVPLIKELKHANDGTAYVRRIDYKIPADFMKNNGMLLVKSEDLDNIVSMFSETALIPFIRNMNDNFEKEYIEDNTSLSTREKEEGAFRYLDGIEYLIHSLKNAVTGDKDITNSAVHTADKLLVGEEYMMSYDKSALIISVLPTFSMMDIKKVTDGTDAVQGVIDELMKKYPGVDAGLSGMIPIQHDENVWIQKSLGYTSVIALVAVLVLLVLAFRMLVAPVFGLITLVIGVIWAVGTATLTVGSLNMMTSTMAVILIGLGIDFGIHIISNYTENRSLGQTIDEALSLAYKNSGKGVITGGLTTAIAFFSLIVSRTRGMKEMGIVLGGGVLAVMIVSVIVLPALLVLRDKRREKKGVTATRKIDLSFSSLGTLAGFLSENRKSTIIISILLTVFMFYKAATIKFDHNYLNMEPKGLKSIELQDLIIDKFDLSMDYGLILAESVEESRRFSESVKESSIVAAVEDISAYLPSQQEQLIRLEKLKELKKKLSVSDEVPPIKETANLIDELARLEMNIMEMQDMAFVGGQDRIDFKCDMITGNPDRPDDKSKIAELIELIEEEKNAAVSGLSSFQEVFSPYMKQAVLRMCPDKLITLGDLPGSITERYSNKENNLFLLTVFPSVNVWNNKNTMNRFSEDLEKTSPGATGMTVIMGHLIKIMGDDGKKALKLTILIVFILLLLDFMNPVHAVIAMIPLVAGTIWMVGLMNLAGLKFTLMNVMGLPLIIGIGIDDGVHIVHRWKVEGNMNVRKIFASTGKAIMLTSLTTILAFGSLIFSVYRGFGSLGSAMAIGVAACFFSTLLILPAILPIRKEKTITGTPQVKE